MAQKQKRAALYLRVSTDQQTVENQRQALVAVAERRGWTVVAEYADNGISGAKGRDERAGLDKLLKDATRGKFDVAMFWSVDRLGRSVKQVSATLDELRDLGVAPYADKEGMDGTTPHGRAMLQMAAVFAELERAMIQARVNAGLQRARQAGRTLGRPKVASGIEQAIAEHLKAGIGVLKVAREMGVGTSVVQRVKAQMVA